MTKDEKFEDYVFPLFRYHSRWSELEDDDFEHWFSKDPVTHNGYYMRADVRAEGEFPDPTPLTDYTLGSNAMDYLDRIRKLCEEKGMMHDNEQIFRYLSAFEEKNRAEQLSLFG